MVILMMEVMIQFYV